MKRKLLSVITALALCLSLLPGTAWAADETGVTFTNRDNSVTLTDGKFYVAAADNNGITQQDDEPTDDPYLAYSGGTLTVHGAVETTAIITVNSDLIITGDEGASLTVGSESSSGIQFYKDSTLTLDGQVDFKAYGFTCSDPSKGTLVATEEYSGNIVVRNGSVNVAYDVKNSGSIDIQGVVSCSDDQAVTLKSTGDITLSQALPAPLSCKTATLEGANVSLTSTGAAVYVGESLTINSENAVTITSAGVPVLARGENPDGLTVKNATAVTITGKSSEDDAFFPVPVTFKNCGSVTVEDAEENNSFLKEGVTLTSDVPVYVTKGGVSNKHIYINGTLWFDNGDAAEATSINPGVNSKAPPTVWKAGDGWVFYDPPTDENPTAKLTLDNAEYPDGAIGLNTDVSVEVKGRNHVGSIQMSGSMKLNIPDGATLNTLVLDTSNSENGKTIFTVYGKAKLLDGLYCFVGADPDNPDDKYYLTIPQGAELTIPKIFYNGSETPGLIIYDLDKAYLRNEGTIVNNETVALTGNAAQSANAQTIKSLGLTGTGTVVVGELDEYYIVTTVDATYTNNGVKLLEPVNTLDLNTEAANNDYTEAWDTKGYKWTDVVRDETSGDITSAKLTLKEGFNASEVILPDAAVEIVSEGECLIGKLLIADGSGANHTQLTLSGKGPLNIQNHVEITGGTENSLTAARGAQIQVTGGVTVGAAGGVDGIVTVSGILTAAGDSLYAGVRTGKLEIGSSGTLRVSGETGVFLGGKSVDVTTKDFAGAFTVQTGGRFEARCNPTIISASTDADIQFSEDTETEVIVVPNGYLPSGCVLAFSNGKKELTISGDGSLFNISVDNVPPSGGGGWVGPSTYTVTVEESTHGTVTSDRRTASRGDTVTLTVTADSGCALNTLTVTDSQGNEIELTALGDGKYTFTMPGRAVTVRAAFISSACTGGADCPSRAFSDLDTSKWYHEAVDYVLRNDLMDGYDNGLFGPDDTLTRAQFVQILFNKEGRPAVNYLLRYDDAAPGAWYTEAVRWAASLGIAGGYGNGMFGPNDDITREQLAVMLWRYTGSPAATEKELRFTDADKVSGYALEALRWAVEKGIINGKGSGILDPTGQATRAETAQILRSFMEK